MLSIIIPWYNRFELKQALPSIMQSLKEIDGNLTIVNLGGDCNVLKEQLNNYPKITIIHTLPRKYFNKPVAQNLGAKYTSSPYLFFCDCDIILSPHELTKLFETVSHNLISFGTIAQVTETKINARAAGNLAMFGYQLKLKLNDGAEVIINDNEEDATNGTRQAPGLLLVKREHFERIGGYNSSLDGWGWEDQDMICRLSLAAKLQRINYGKVLHISHDDTSRMLGYKQFSDRWQSRDYMFRKALKNYDENQFMGTYFKDIEEPVKIEISR